MPSTHRHIAKQFEANLAYLTHFRFIRSVCSTLLCAHYGQPSTTTITTAILPPWKERKIENAFLILYSIQMKITYFVSFFSRMLRKDNKRSFIQANTKREREKERKRQAQIQTYSSAIAFTNDRYTKGVRTLIMLRRRREWQK